MGKKYQKSCPVALTVAGSDSGGGAGIQADLRTFTAFRVFGCSVITAVTSQNPSAVSRVDALPGEAVAAQMKAVSVFNLKAVKTGMLFNSSVISALVPFFKKLKKAGIPLVIDPVMVSTSGAKLLRDDAQLLLRDKLFPLASWITPNIPEAELISGKKLRGGDEMARAALYFHEKWGLNSIIKGGHIKSSSSAGKVTDIVAYNGRLYSLSSPAAPVEGMLSHGTGCTLSAALTASFAMGMSWRKALVSAKAFVYGSMIESVSSSETFRSMFPPVNSYEDFIDLKSYN